MAKVHGDLRLQLISLDYIHLRAGELTLVLRHRFILMTFLALIIGLILVDANGRARELPIEMRAPVYMLGVLAGLGALVTYIRVIEFLFGHGGRNVTVPMSPGLLLGAGVGLFCSESLTQALFFSPPMTVFQGVLLTIFYYVLLEIIMSLVAHLVIPPVLSEIRAEAVRTLADSAKPAPELPPADPVAEEEALPVVMVVSGPHRFRSSDILAMEATGNYVNVTTDAGRKLVQGPFSAVLTQVPSASGMRTHRSHWVAMRAVAGYVRHGRDVSIRLTNGIEVPVATPRQAEVMAWLRDLGVGELD